MADSAKAIIEGVLARLGLSALGDWAWQQRLAGASPEEIFIEMKTRPEYLARFPAMAELEESGRAISEEAYVEYENSVKQMLQWWGVAAGMYDTPAGIADLLLNDVSAAEVNERLQRAAVAAFSTPDEVLEGLRMQGYPVDIGDLTSFYLDPDQALPLIEQKYKTAQVIGAASQQRIDLMIEEAERLAKQGIGWEQAQQGFATVAGTRGLAAGQGEVAGQPDRIKAVFGDQAALEKVTRVQQSRRARFSGGGSAAETNEGVTGLGGASTR